MEGGIKLIKSGGYLMKQRAFIQLYVLTFIEEGRPYGIQMLEQLRERFRDEGYKPNHAEIYRALHELVDSGVIKASKKKLMEDSYQEITIYHIRDAQKAKQVKGELIEEVERSMDILRKTIIDVRD